MMLGPTSPRQCSSRAASKYPTGPVLTGKGTCELHALRCGVSCGLAVSPRAGPASSELGGGWMGCRGCCLRAKETPPPSPSSSMPRSRLAPSLPMAQDLCTRVHTGLVTGRGHPPPPPSSPLLKHQAKGRLQSSSTEAEAFKPLRMLLGDHQLRREQTTLCRCCCSLPRRLRSHLPSLSPTTRASPVAWGMLEHGEMR